MAESVGTFRFDMDGRLREFLKENRKPACLGILLTSMLVGCVSPESGGREGVPVAPEMVAELDGVVVYRGIPDIKRYDLLGYASIESRSASIDDIILAELRRQAIQLGGNGLIELEAEVVFDAGLDRPSYGIGMDDIRRYAETTVTDRYRWRAKVILAK